MASETDRDVGASASGDPQIDWASIFQSTEFSNALQDAVSKVSNASTLATAPQQVAPSSAAQEPLQGTFTAPTFISATGGETRSGRTGAPSVIVPSLQPDLAVASAPMSTVPTATSTLDKAFILGPGRAPIPAKLVTQITSSQFVEMNELMPENLEAPLLSQSTTFTIEGSSIIPKSDSRKKKEVSDILTWDRG